MKIRTTLAVLGLTVVMHAIGLAQDKADPTKEMLEQIAKLNEAVKGFRATMEVHDKRGAEEQVGTSKLTVSREFGWKVEDTSTTGGHIVVNDFKTSYEYDPQAKKAYKMTADLPELIEGFRKPAAELNSLAILDPKSIKLLGQETFEGEPVYHVEGTTTTQLLMGGKPVTRKIEAWVSRRDGMSRKTVEYTEFTVGTTVYRDLEVNPELKAEDFVFQAPKGVEVIDLNAEMRKQQDVQGKSKRR